VLSRFARLAAALSGLLLIGATSAQPRALAGVEPGLWEVSRSATGRDPKAMCLRDLQELAAVGHPGERCTRTVLSDQPGELLLDLSCPRDEFARSQISVITPRSVKVETQGIHGGAPFAITLYARRKGPCPQNMSGR
jgi:hypothetical protein